MGRTSSQYWFPLLVPLLIGLLLPLLQLNASFSETETMQGLNNLSNMRSGRTPSPVGPNEEGEVLDAPEEQKEFSMSKAIKIDLRKFLTDAVKSLVVAVISIDVWALTTLFTVRDRTQRSNLAFAVPVVALLLHVCLMIGATSIPGKPGEFSLAKTISETLILLLAFVAAGWVREVIWKNIDGIERTHNNLSHPTAKSSA